MQLAAFNNNNFALGHAAMPINEGLPLYLVHRLEQRYDLAAMTVGILGMAFKGELRRHPVQPVLQAQADPALQGGRGAVHRPVRDHRPGPAAAGRGLEQVDLLIIAAPHPEYRDLATDKPVADIWNIRGEGVRI